MFPTLLPFAASGSVCANIVADYQAGSSGEQIEAAQVLIEQGKPVALAASELDIAVRSLHYELKRRGLPTRASLVCSRRINPDH